MLRLGFLIVAVSLGSTADAATLIVQTVSSMRGVNVDGPVGGSDIQGVATNTASGDAFAQFSSQMSIPGGVTSGFASGNVANGQMKARIQSNPGTYYVGVDDVDVYFAEGGGASEVAISETFIASGSGTVRFDLAFDGFWDIAAQQYLFNSPSGLEAGFFDAMWQIQGSLTLAGLGVLSGDSFFFKNNDDPDTGSVVGVLSAAASVIDGQEYGISMSLLTQLIGGASGGIDFSNTAVLSFTSDPGVTLQFSDSRFLSQMSAIPLPAPGVLLLFAIGGLAAFGRRRLASKQA